jgi:drug/metabolite transporter (DMT)-like permease
MLLAMACYVLNDALIKLAAARYGTGQILLLRGSLASMMLLAVVARARLHHAWRQTLRPIVALRALLEITTAATSVAALSRMPLSTVTSIMMIAPLIVAAVSMATGREPRRLDRVLAATAGFVGVLMVVRPSSAVDLPGLALALACAASLAGRELVNRAIPLDVPSLLVASVTTLAVTLAGAAMATLEVRAPTDPRTLTWMVGAAVFTAVGNSAVVAATRRADLSVVAPFRFSNIVWALVLGFAVWNEVPDWRALIGIALVAGSGACVLRSTRRAPGAGR